MIHDGADTDSLNPLICLIVGVEQPLENVCHEELAEIKVDMTSAANQQLMVLRGQ